jgi:hypothetical protein
VVYGSLLLCKSVNSKRNPRLENKEIKVNLTDSLITSYPCGALQCALQMIATYRVKKIKEYKGFQRKKA